MQSFSIHTKLTLADWHALQRAYALRLQQRERPTKTWFVIVLWAAGAFAACALFDALDFDLQLSSLIVGVALCALILFGAYRGNKRAAEPREGGAFLSPCVHEFSAEGIASTQSMARSVSQWQRITDVTATAEHVFVWIDIHAAFVIPVRDLPEGLTAEQVVASCKEWMAAPAAPESALPPSSVAVAVEAQPAPRTIEIADSPWRTAFRLLTLRSVEHPGRPSGALSGKLLPILLLTLVSLALWAGLSWFYFLPDPQFYPYSAPALAWYVLAVLTIAGAMAMRSHPQVIFSRVISMLAILIPLLIVADFAIVKLVPERWIAIARAVPVLYAIVFCSRGLHALTGSRQPTAVFGGLFIALAFFWVASELYVYPAVWTSEDPEGYAADYEAQLVESEPLLFEQPARIDAALARIEAARGAAPAGFFVGFAGYGKQRVFAEEIKFAAGKFDERYDVADRTLLLINDQRDRDSQPLATVSGLGYALKGLASKMRLDRDVLFLALSSHGSEDPLLSVDNGILPLNDLTGDALAEALRASGIKWRVIVISACHAGAFIESLQDPHTIVITAAAPDRTSFGCSDERDLTYFGEAFFRDSLPQAASLREAFDTAAKLVSEREAAEGFKASNPQAFFGEDIEPRIASMLHAAKAQ